MTIDPEAARRSCAGRIDAIITCDYAGQPSDYDELILLQRQTGATLIADSCHALGATYRRRRIGSIAALTAFSLHPVKHVTCGEGGMVTTDNSALASRLRSFRTHGIVDKRQGAAATWEYDMADLGFNFRITDFQCALGRSQLRHADTWLARRRFLAERYRQAFQLMPQLEVPVVLDDRVHAWHLFVIRFRLGSLRVGRAEIFRALRAENIGVNVHYIPVPWHSYYEALGYRRGDWPVAEDAYNRMLSLPLFPSMSDEDADDVINAVKKVIDHYGR
jgi:dTDP-4-amino-4,6-dideoxygalactose transaminase